ncbi:hypothetical protein HAX54_050396 [Datura stramonium]|uniref:Uncharacterized protein n=1 Tax=Datura stramonium TaxID=4076 RepID=A0ABS8SWY0_DATST|nr:hypothetical protein [Datura stramonium]
MKRNSITQEVEDKKKTLTNSKQRIKRTTRKVKENTEVKWGIRVEEENEEEQFTNEDSNSAKKEKGKAREEAEKSGTKKKSKKGIIPELDGTHELDDAENIALKVREQDQMSSTENNKDSPNKELNEICSHKGVEIISAHKEIKIAKEIDKEEALKTEH